MSSSFQKFLSVMGNRAPPEDEEAAQCRRSLVENATLAMPNA
jgi:hypothetical protein